MKHTLLLFLAQAFFASLTVGYASENPLCEIHWKNHAGASVTLQFAFIKKGCAMEGSPKIDCYVVRKSEDKSWTLGEGVIRKDIAPSTLCLAPELFHEGEAQATLICDANLPKAIRLNGPSKIIKTCALPKNFP